MDNNEELKTLGASIISGKNASKLSENEAVKSVFSSIEGSLDARMMSCNTAKGGDEAADIVRCKQLLAGIKREILQAIATGEYAKTELEEMRKAHNLSTIKRVFTR